MHEKAKRGLDIEVYDINPATGEESQHRTLHLEPVDQLPMARLMPPCECGDQACHTRGRMRVVTPF